MKGFISPFTMCFGLIVMGAALLNNLDPIGALDGASLHSFNLKLGAAGVVIFFIGSMLSLWLNPVKFHQTRPKNWANDKVWR